MNEKKESPFVFVCFTCKRDEKLLPPHYAAIQAACPGAPVWYCIHTDDSPMKTPEGAALQLSSFQRNGNLRGGEALIGIVDTLIYVARVTGKIPIKIDSDVFFIGAEWLKGLELSLFDLVGVSPRGLFCASGACYSVTLSCLEKIREYLHQTEYHDTFNDRPEDETISFLAAVVSKPLRVFIYQHCYKDGSILSCIFKPELKTDDYSHLLMVSGYIDCGSRVLTDAMSVQGMTSTDAKAWAMQKCAELFALVRKKREC